MLIREHISQASAVCSFQSETLPSVDFVACALSDGRISISRSILGLTADHANLRHGQFATVLLIESLPHHMYGREESDDSQFTLLAWGGGRHHLLAAATTRYLHLFSLKSFFSDLPMQLSSSHLSLPITSQGYCSLGLPRPLTHPLLCMDWTQDGSGIFIADAANNVAMLSVSVSDASYGGSKHKLEAEVKEEWGACSDSSHSLAAAGLGTKHPSATSPHPQIQQPQVQSTLDHPHLRSSSPAPPASQSQQHRVIIWWPPKDKEEKKDQSSRPPRTSSSSSVGAEVIRHSVRVLSMQWSHGQERLTSEETGMPSPSPSSSPKQPTPPSLPQGPQGLALMTLGADWSIRIFVEVMIFDLFSNQAPGSSNPPPPTSSPPLPPTSYSQFCLTLVIDPPFASSLPPPLPFTCPRMRASWAKPLFPYPRSHDIDTEDRQSISFSSGDVARALNSKVHWIVASADVGVDGSMESLVCIWAVDSLSGVILSGLPRGALSSSKTTSPKAILWGTCSSSPCNSPLVQNLAPSGPGAGASRNLAFGSNNSIASISLGLKSKASTSLPPHPPHAALGGHNGPSSSSTATYCPHLSWTDPSSLFQPPPHVEQQISPSSTVAHEDHPHQSTVTQSAAPIASGGKMTAYVIYPDGVPVINAIDCLQRRDKGGGNHSEFKSIQMTTVTTKDFTPPSPGRDHSMTSASPRSLTTSIKISSLAHKCLPSLPNSISYFEAHPGSSDEADAPLLALSLDRDGVIGIWSMRDPLEYLPSLSPNAFPGERTQAAAWLPSIHKASSNQGDGFVAYLVTASVDLVLKVHAILVPPLGSGRASFLNHVHRNGRGFPLVQYIGSCCSSPLHNGVEKILVLRSAEGSIRLQMILTTIRSLGWRGMEDWSLDSEGFRTTGKIRHEAFIASPSLGRPLSSLTNADVSCLCCPDEKLHGAVAVTATSDGSLQLWGEDLQLLASFPPPSDFNVWMVQDFKVHSHSSLIAVLKVNDRGLASVSLFKLDVTSKMSHGSLRLEAEIIVSSQVERAGASFQIAWARGAGICPVLAVSTSGASGLVQLYSRSPRLPSEPDEQRWKWTQIARYCTGSSGSKLMLSSGSKATLNVTSSQPLVISSLSNIISSQDPLTNQRSLIDSALPGLSLPPYHPLTLTALVSKGLMSESNAILRSLLSWLRKRTRELELEDGDTMLGSMDEGSKEDSSHERLKDQWSVLMSPLLLESRGLVGTKGLQALIEFIQMREKPTSAVSPSAVSPGILSGVLSSSSSSTTPTTLAPPTTRQGTSTGSSILSSFSMKPKPVEPPPTFTPAAQKAATADPMSSGMIDMSAFGMFSMGDGDDEEEPPLSPPLPPPPSPPPSGMESGMLDMAAFGFSAFNEEDPEEDESPSPLPPAPLISLPSSSEQPMNTPTDAAGGMLPFPAGGMFPFPRIAEDNATPLSSSSSLTQPLNESEVNELISLLLGPKQAKALRLDTTSSSSSSSLAPPSSYLPSYLRDDEDLTEKAQEERALTLRNELGLIDNGSDLVGKSLASASLSLSSPSSSGSSSSYQQLDPSSRVYLSSFRLHMAAWISSLGPSQSSSNLQKRIQSQPSLSLSLSSSSSILSLLDESKSSQLPLGARLGLAGGHQLPSSTISSLMRAVLWAQSSSSQGALVEALLPNSPVMEDDDMDSSAAPSTLSGPGGGAKSSGAAAGMMEAFPSWPRWRRMGLGLWLIDAASLKNHAEALSRAQFQKRRDPFDCSLLYAALGKRSALQALFRQSSNLRLADFLARDFGSEEGRHAAAKNAFTLLGQHRYDLAATFFILADQPMDAIGVLLKDRKDPQLALFIARLLDTTNGGKQMPMGSSSSMVQSFELSQWLVDQELVPWIKAEPNKQLAAVTKAVLLFASGRASEGVLSLLPPSPDPSTLDPFLIDFILKRGLSKLSPPPRGFPSPSPSSSSVPHLGVPSFIPERILESALTSASILESMGLPAFALDPISMASILRFKLIGSEGIEVSKGGDPLTGYSERLLASSFCTQSSSHSARDSFELPPVLVDTVHHGLNLLEDHWKGSLRPQSSVILSTLLLQMRGSQADDRIDLPPAPDSDSNSNFRDPSSPNLDGPSMATIGGEGGGGGSFGKQRGGGRISSSGGSIGSHSRISIDSSASVKRVWGGGHPHPYSLQHQSMFSDEPLEVLKIDGDRIRGVACSGVVTSDGAGRPFCVVTGHNGLLWGGLSPPGNKSVQLVEDESPAASFLGLMSQVLDTVRWTPDPWGAAMAEGPISGTGGHGHHQVTRRRLSETSAEASHTHAATVTAHPDRDFYISGSSADQVFLWKHGETVSRANYIPMIEAEALKHQTLLPGFVITPHWDSAASIAHSRCGTRFAGIGHGGLVSVWSDERVGQNGIGYASWAHHCISRQGNDIVLLGDQGSQLVVCGKGERGGAISWWDVNAGPPGPRSLVAEVKGSKGTIKHEPTSLALVHAPASPLLVYGDDAGDLHALDLRMLTRPLWSLLRAHQGSVQSLDTWASGTHSAPTASVLLSGVSKPSPSRSATTPPLVSIPLQSLLVSGGKDGSLVLVDVMSGRVVDAVPLAHWTSSKNPLAGVMKLFAGPSASGQHRSGASISSVVCLQDGILTCGSDGAVRLIELSPEVVMEK